MLRSYSRYRWSFSSGFVVSVSFLYTKQARHFSVVGLRFAGAFRFSEGEAVESGQIYVLECGFGLFYAFRQSAFVFRPHDAVFV